MAPTPSAGDQWAVAEVVGRGSKLDKSDDSCGKLSLFYECNITVHVNNMCLRYVVDAVLLGQLDYYSSMDPTRF